MKQSKIQYTINTTLIERVKIYYQKGKKYIDDKQHILLIYNYLTVTARTV